MANEQRGLCVGFYTASADLTALQYHFAKVSGSKTLTVVAANTDEAVGVIQNAPASGAAVDLMVTGISKVVAGAAITAGAKIGTDASGRAVTAVSTKTVLGKAMTTVANAGEIVEVLLPYVYAVAP